MAGDIKTQYGSSESIAFTSSQSLAASATLVSGAFSAEIDNTSNEYGGYIVGGKVKMEATARAAGTFALYCWGSIDDSTGVVRPDLGAGTAITGADSAGSWNTVSALNAGTRLHTAIATDSTGGGKTYPIAPLDVAVLFGGRLPKRFGFYVASTLSALDSAAQAVTLNATPVMDQYT